MTFGEAEEDPIDDEISSEELEAELDAADAEADDDAEDGDEGEGNDGEEKAAAKKKKKDADPDAELLYTDTKVPSLDELRADTGREYLDEVFRVLVERDAPEPAR